MSFAVHDSAGEPGAAVKAVKAVGVAGAVKLVEAVGNVAVSRAGGITWRATVART
jgi:hypothetical protein